MKIKLNKSIYEQDYLSRKYSKYAEEGEKIEGIPYINFSFEVEEIPNKYKYLSWVFIDYDSNPVVQFSWIHWLIANYEINPKNLIVPECLVNNSKKYIGGTNSFAGPLTNIKSEKVILNYGGPTPPDTDHVYTLIVYAHDNELDLQKGFYYNEFLNQLEKVEHTSNQVKILAKK